MKNMILPIAIALLFVSGCSTQYRNIDPARSNQVQFDQDQSYCNAVAAGNVPMPHMQQYQNNVSGYAPSSGTMRDQYGNTYRYQENYNAMAAAQNNMAMAQQSFNNANTSFQNAAAHFKAMGARVDIVNYCMAQLGWREISNQEQQPSPLQEYLETVRKNTREGQVSQKVDVASFAAVRLAQATPEEMAKLQEASQVYAVKDYARAVNILTPLAESGSARAAFSLGLMAMRGHGMSISIETAENWWICSAQGGFPDAQFHLGFMYHNGLCGGRNPILIARLWSLAAEQGQGDAMYKMGFMYLVGDGVPKDLQKSREMFTNAANLGHPGAIEELAAF